jgi:NADH-quinone oxidoreductase subunit G/NADP-reducing hydrogenase subunit HndD
MIQVTINDQIVQAYEGETILDVASRYDINIPTLCYLKELHQIGSCRVCVVEVEGAKSLMASCVTPVSAGMVIKTNTARVRKARKVMYELMLSDHPADCLHCDRNQSCELQALGEQLQVRTSRFEGIRSKMQIDETSPSIVRDSQKCILCRRCVTMCQEIQGVGALSAQNRGFSTEISPGAGLLLGTAVCSNCGQCTTVCPVNALHEKDSTELVWQALADSEKYVVVQTAPAVRAALGEEFGLPAGTLVTGKMAAALRRMGFSQVFDTNFTADLTILEEGTELLGRLVSNLYKQGLVNDSTLENLGMTGQLPEHDSLPMITSCSPGWIKYVEHFHAEKLEHLSTCKSPHMMLGALVKTWFAENAGIDPASIYMVSVMPCTAKKYEITRPEMSFEGLPQVDAVLTTRELAKMIKEAGINFISLPDETFDSPMGLSSGAADIFGVTGGVMEAALRTVFELVTGRELPFDKLHVMPVEGFEQIKTASVRLEKLKPEWAFLEGIEVKVAVTHGLKGARQLAEEIESDQSPYHFIEIMGCPGGCISGGGQPRPTNNEIRQKRLEAIYREDENKQLRKSHENPDIAALYEQYLIRPCSDISHHLLHTSYTRRNRI